MKSGYWISILIIAFLFTGCNFSGLSGLSNDRTSNPIENQETLLGKPALPTRSGVVQPGFFQQPQPVKPELPTRGTPVKSDEPYANGTKTTPESDAGVQWVTNPTTKSRLYVMVNKPVNTRPGGKYPMAVLIPGGIGDSGGFTGPGKESERFPAAGVITVIFDADGRGRSSGTEDFNGYSQQDGLAEIIRQMAAMPEVDPKKIALISYSYGVTMASGVLARYPDLPVRFFIDWEGPVNRNYTTTGCGSSQRIAWKPCTDNAWWAEREALTFTQKVRIPYQRVQSQIDHVQPTNNHAIEMVNTAVKSGMPWVRLNNLPPNQTYDLTNQPAMIPEQDASNQTAMMLRFLLEMLRLHAGL